MERYRLRFAIVAAVVFFGIAPGKAESTKLYFGDTHVHTSWSFDALTMGGNTLADPNVAFRWARGLPIAHPTTGLKVAIDRPLDFLMVTDHAELLGLMVNTMKGEPELLRLPGGEALSDILKKGDMSRAIAAVSKLMRNDDTRAVSGPSPDISALNGKGARELLWSRYSAIADRYDQPGIFSAFIGWEWTAMPPGYQNLHRVVFTDGDASVARKFLPFTSIDSDRPEDLWRWLDKTTKSTKARFVAIPHNSNASAGLMFAETDSDNKPITAEYAGTRMRWEPVVEITQVKGDSETLSELSPNDEFADFERFRYLFGPSGGMAKPDRADYVRSALLRGLEIESRVGRNPYKFGIEGSSDIHTGFSAVDEANFYGKFAAQGTPEKLLAPDGRPFPGAVLSASGLAAVWAVDNTRKAIFDAFLRKEVYGTTGPRMRVRFFGGWGFQPRDAKAGTLAEAGYRDGVPMGGELTRAPKGKSPAFLIQAVKDPAGANLDRVQVIKGWLGRDGKAEEKVFDVAWSGKRTLNAAGKLPPVGDTVDAATARYTNEIGAPELIVIWSDPEFDPRQHAFYYVRVLEIPTPRHILYEAVALQVEPPKGFPISIQERAYTSPIWYTP